MRLNARTILTALLLTGCATLAGCGRENKSTNTVQMKDLEVVDGTTTDAMTDLDGAQSQAPAPAASAAGSENASAPAPKEEPAANAAQSDTEVVSDQ